MRFMFARVYVGSHLTQICALILAGAIKQHGLVPFAGYSISATHTVRYLINGPAFRKKAFHIAFQAMPLLFFTVTNFHGAHRG